MEPPDRRPGELISADEYNVIKHAAMRRFTGPGVMEDIDGVHLRPPTMAGRTHAFKVVEERHDYLICIRWNAPVASVRIEVAKPWLLQRTPFDGKTYDGVLYTFIPENPNLPEDPETNPVKPGHRTATLTVDLREGDPPKLLFDIVEEQAIRSAYLEGTRIVAVRVWGGTDVMTDPEPAQPDADPPVPAVPARRVLWEQQGDAGRDWKVPLERDQ